MNFLFQGNFPFSIKNHKHQETGRCGNKNLSSIFIARFVEQQNHLLLIGNIKVNAKIRENKKCPHRNKATAFLLFADITARIK